MKITAAGVYWHIQSTEGLDKELISFAPGVEMSSTSCNNFSSTKTNTLSFGVELSLCHSGCRLTLFVVYRVLRMLPQLILQQYHRWCQPLYVCHWRDGMPVVLSYLAQDKWWSWMLYLYGEDRCGELPVWPVFHNRWTSTCSTASKCTL